MQAQSNWGCLLHGYENVAWLMIYVTDDLDRIILPSDRQLKGCYTQPGYHSITPELVLTDQSSNKVNDGLIWWADFGEPSHQKIEPRTFNGTKEKCTPKFIFTKRRTASKHLHLMSQQIFCHKPQHWWRERTLVWFLKFLNLVWF